MPVTRSRAHSSSARPATPMAPRHIHFCIAGLAGRTVVVAECMELSKLYRTVGEPQRVSREVHAVSTPPARHARHFPPVPPARPGPDRPGRPERIPVDVHSNTDLTEAVG